MHALHQVVSEYQTKGNVACMREMRNTYTNLDRKREGKNIPL
jgi:hypothetical protein